MTNFNDFDYTSVNAIKKLLNLNDFAMCKKFGQNFLINQQMIQKITDKVIHDVDRSNVIYEVGPGIGVLTSNFIKEGYNVNCFEIDRGFIKILKSFFPDESLNITEGDVLKTIWTVDECPYVLCGNLPYNISSVLIADILEKIMNNYQEKMEIELIDI